MTDKVDDGSRAPGFAVHLDVFDGPFDLLLTLIAKRELDVTVVALSAVTEEFIAYLRAARVWDLSQASEFVVVAATLLDLKAARLLPAGEADDEEDLAAWEARDLLFARLLQYRAFKDIAVSFADRLEQEASRFARAVPLEQRYAPLEPKVSLGVDAAGFAAVAVRALAPHEPPLVPVDHLHLPVVSVHEQAALLAERLHAAGSGTFRRLAADTANTLELVARFLAVLELYRQGSVVMEQVRAFSDVHLRWVVGDPREWVNWSIDLGVAQPAAPTTTSTEDGDSGP
jgi:segregation and condensation protein A